MIQLNPIGVAHTPFIKSEGTPIQSIGSNTGGEIEVFEKYTPGLKDLNGFSHIILLYHFHRIEKECLTVVPFMDTAERGVFSTRSPSRPNRLGFSALEIVRIVNNVIHVKNIDILNETPILDIKPYIPTFDSLKAEKTGWLEPNIRKHGHQKDDGRFL